MRETYTCQQAVAIIFENFSQYNNLKNTSCKINNTQKEIDDENK